MILKPSILNVPVVLFMIGCVIYTICNYKTLSHGEGWGVVYVIGLCGLGLLLLVLDIAIQNIFKNNTAIAKTIQIILLLMATLSLFLKI